MTTLETSIAGLIKTFDKYAGGEGKKDTLTKAEMKTLVETELPSLIKGAKNPAMLGERLKDLDFNGDSEVDFKEFVVFVAVLACAAHGRACKK
ncbi:protein S100-P-like [Limanda limanda]|uniref:protein S100-P-like n=1 Tax=Limanda limanda TaxID=27771 RepID=UPI0029C62EDE|nr:protein S100-P-like [Limanda limanda]